MASPRASPARLQHNKGVTVYTQGILIFSCIYRHIMLLLADEDNDDVIESF